MTEAEESIMAQKLFSDVCALLGANTITPEIVWFIAQSLLSRYIESCFSLRLDPELIALKVEGVHHLIDLEYEKIKNRFEGEGI